MGHGETVGGGFVSLFCFFLVGLEVTHFTPWGPKSLVYFWIPVRDSVV